MFKFAEFVEYVTMFSVAVVSFCSRVVNSLRSERSLGPKVLK